MKLASILLVEDDSLLRTSLKQSLISYRFDVVAAVATAAEAVVTANENEFEVAILDIDLGIGANGIDVAKKLREIKPNLGIIFLTNFSDPRLVKNTAIGLPIGAQYIQKTKIEDIDQLLTLILQVRKNPLGMESKLNENQLALSQIQIQILQMLAEGLTTSEIAKTVECSERAIEKNLNRIQKILNVPAKNGKNSRILLANAYWKLIGKQ